MCILCFLIEENAAMCCNGLQKLVIGKNGLSGSFLDGWIKFGRAQFKNSCRWLRVEVCR